MNKQFNKTNKSSQSNKSNQLELITKKYQASQGTEYFISYENKENDLLYGFIRLRIPHDSLRKEITSKSALIRELHVYGTQTQIGENSKDKIQHIGLGKKLLKYAEKIAKENHKVNKMVIISGIGVRNYYRKHNYKKQGPYMVKKLW